MGPRISYLRGYIDDHRASRFSTEYTDEDQHELCSDGRSLLSAAINCRSKDIINFLLKRDNIDVCKAGCEEKTPLYAAVETQKFELVKTLIELGALPTIQTAFLKAIEVENFEIVKYLHEKGALVNFKYNSKASPLTAAINTGNVSVAKYLRHQGAKWQLIDEKDKDVCLSNLVQSNHFDMVGFIAKNLGVNLNKHITDDYNLLTLSIEKGNFKMVKSLLEYGANVNAFDRYKRLPLALAISKNHLQIAVYLLQSGADIHLAKQEVDDYAKKNDNFRACLETINQHKPQISGSGHDAAKEWMEN